MKIGDYENMDMKKKNISRIPPPLRFMLVYCHTFMISYNLALIHRDKLRKNVDIFSLADLGAFDDVYY